MNEIEDEIKLLKSENREEVLYIWYYTHVNYIKCLIKYGKDSNITKRSLEIFKEFLEVIKIENKIMNAFLKQKVNIFIPEALEILDDLDELHEDTYNYFREMIEDVEDAYEMNQEYRLKSPKKEFKMINETNVYMEEATRVLIGFRPMEDFLNFPKEYWEYIDGVTTVLDDNLEESMDFIGVYYKLDNEGKIIKIKVVVPRIIDLKTLLINIHENHHAYLLYQNLNKRFIDMDYEGLAKQAENEFMTRKFVPIYNKYFSK